MNSAENGIAGGSGYEPADGDTQLTCRFITSLGEELKVPEDPVNIPASVTRYGLSQVINAMLELDPPRPFDFLVEGQLLRAPLHKLLIAEGVSAESVLTVEYMPAVLPPTTKQQCPHDDWVTAVVGEEGELPVTGSSDGLIRTWELGSGGDTSSCVKAFFAHAGGVTALAKGSVGSVGPTLFSAGKDATVRMWKAGQEGNSELLVTYSGHTDSVEGVAVSPDSSRIATCGWDATVKLWRSGEAVVENAVIANKSAKQGKKRRTAGGQETTLAEGGATEEAWGNLEGHSQCTTGVAWIDSHQLASASWDHSVRVWDANSAANTETLNTPKAVNCLAVTKGGTVVFGSSDRVLRVWDPRGKGEALNLRGFASHAGWIKCVSSVGSLETHFVTGSYDHSLKLWDLRSSVPLATIKGHTDKVLCTGWLGKSQILSGGSDCSLRIHDVQAEA